VSATVLLACAGMIFVAQASYAAQPAPSAEGYPTKPVRLIVAQGTGSSVDNLGRLLAQRLTEEWGRQVIVDNRGGAGGTIGGEIAARAVPDGYTLLMSSTAMQVISPQVYKNLHYHPVRDFAQLSLIGSTQNVLVANQKVPYRTMKELIAYARANPGRINMANAGSGFQSHLAAVYFTHLAAIDVHHIPYKGGTSLTAVAAGESHIAIVPIPSAIGHLRAGRLFPMVTGGEKRSLILPEVPTAIESGLPGFVSTGWAGVVVQKDIAKPLFDRIYASLIKVVNDPTTRKLLQRQGAEPMTSTPEEFRRHIEAEFGRFAQAIKLAGLTVQ